MIHHIIPLHEWKKRINPRATRWNKEFNSPDNRVNLTTEQHSQAHQLCYELNGIKYDHLVSLSISGQIGKEELIRQVIFFANKGRHLSQAHKEKLRIMQTGKKLSKEHREACSIRQLGKKRAPYKTKKLGPQTPTRIANMVASKKKQRLLRLLNSAIG
jgi:hypothetical protein